MLLIVFACALLANTYINITMVLDSFRPLTKTENII